ncbi:putative MFS-type transporter [Escovopsis weberi]|uniref:Putative MFS-type transporter n=1 Tax=Escovopsis weberi TaxID=150374 RepID=A0A0M9VSI0_ESCWE|nr:putative MFS-type transporter [Escovopsis weberi]
MAEASGGIIRDFGVTPTQCGYLVSYQLLLLGIGNLFWVPLSLKIGKRPVCVVSSALFFATSIWSAVAKSYGSLLASRIVGGFAASVVEVIGPAVDRLFTLTHRFMIGGGSALGGVFAGLVIHGTDNWRWIFWMCTILTGVCFLFLTLFYQETNFIRPAEAEGGDKAIVDQASFRSPYSLRQALTLFAWYDRSTSIWVYFFRPLPLLLYPAVLWATVCYGVVLGWVVFQISSNAVLFAEIYNFSPFGIGNLYIANVVGAFVGCLYSGPFNDWFCATITKRKTGMFQPEYRLYLMIPLFFLGPVGLLMWGVGLQNRVSWAVPAVGSGISYAVLCMNPNISLTYIIDGYRPVAGEAFTSLTAAKNAVAFGLSFAVFPWINRSGLAHVGAPLGGVV